MLTKLPPLLQIAYIWDGQRLVEVVWMDGIGGRVALPVPKHLEPFLRQVLDSAGEFVGKKGEKNAGE